jgi:hypothetical protein
LVFQQRKLRTIEEERNETSRKRPGVHSGSK